MSPVDTTRAARDRKRARGASSRSAALALIAGGVLGAMWMLHPHRAQMGPRRSRGVSRRADRRSCTGIRSSVPTSPTNSATRCRSSTRRSRHCWPRRSPRLGETPANLAWTAITIVVLAAVVRICFAPLLRALRSGRWPIAFLLTLAAMAALVAGRGSSAFRSGGHPAHGVLHLRLHGRAAPLAARCAHRHRHRGEARPRDLHPLPVVLGSADGGGSGRRRRSACCTLIGLVVTPGDSWDFFHSQIFKPTSPTYFTNQSLEGMIQRVVGGPWRIVWIVAVALVLWYGLRAAVDRKPTRRRAPRGGDHRPGERAGVADLVDPPPRVDHSRARRHRRARAETAARSHSRSSWPRCSSPACRISATTRSRRECSPRCCAIPTATSASRC